VTISGANLQSWNVKGVGGNDLFNVTGTELPLALVGGAGTNTLAGPNQTMLWTISGSNSGTMGATSFANMASLTGGTGDDTFAFQGSGSLSGNLSGGSGADVLDLSGSSSTISVNLATRKATKIGGTWLNLTSFVGDSGSTLTGPNAASTWSVTGPNSGTLGSTSFSGFANLTGGSGNDTFAFQGSALISGNVNGGSGTDTLDLSNSASTATVNMASKTATGIDGTWSSLMAFVGNSGSTLIGPNATTSWSVTGPNSGTVGSTPFSGFADLTGGTGNDTFTISTTGGVTGLIDGGAGTNTLVSPNQTTAWTINGSNGGTMGSVSFADMANLKGGTGSDTFAFQGSGWVSGSVNGGGGTDTLDLSGSASTAMVNLASKTASSIDGTWSNLVAFAGNSGSTLVGPNTATTWTLSAVGSGTAGTTAFNGFANLTGGTGNDKFTVASGAGISGLIDGGASTNTLDFSTYSSSGVIVDLPLGKASATGAIAHIQNVNGSVKGGDILVGDASVNMLRVYAGQNILIGGPGADTLYAGSSSGGDILIGGTTANDSNIAALQTILATWATSTPSTYSAVVATISSVSFDDPLNASTVFDDGSIDVLVGVSGSVNDWFFAHTSGSNLDQVKSRDTGEVVTSI
jgi:Ca2+-binding RTX toxin-like protein